MVNAVIVESAAVGVGNEIEYLVDERMAPTSVIYQFPEQLQREIPAGLEAQAADGRQSFSVNGQALVQKKFRIDVIDAKPIVDESTGEITDVIFVLQLKGVMNLDTGVMCPMTKGRVAMDNEGWLQGYRSNKLSAKAYVEAGMFSEQDYQNLVTYAQWWTSVDRNSNYAGDRASYRNWMATASEDGTGALFSFQIVVRTNPETNEPVLGISSVGFYGLKIAGNGTKGSGTSIIPSIEDVKASNNVVGKPVASRIQRGGYRRPEKAAAPGQAVVQDF